MEREARQKAKDLRRGKIVVDKGGKRLGVKTADEVLGGVQEVREREGEVKGVQL